MSQCSGHLVSVYHSRLILPLLTILHSVVLMAVPPLTFLSRTSQPLSLPTKIVSTNYWCNNCIQIVHNICLETGQFNCKKVYRPNYSHFFMKWYTGEFTLHWPPGTLTPTAVLFIYIASAEISECEHFHRVPFLEVRSKDHTSHSQYFN